METAITKDEKLALLCALDKRVTPALKDAKDEARAEIMDAYAENGTDRKAILVGGEKVGEVGISYSKPAPFIYAAGGAGVPAPGRPRAGDAGEGLGEPVRPHWRAGRLQAHRRGR